MKAIAGIIYLTLVWICPVSCSSALAQDSEDYLHYDAPPDAQKIGPFSDKDSRKHYFNYVYPGSEGSNPILFAVDSYEGDQMIERRLFKDGHRHGVQRTWYKNGQLHTVCPYKNGEMNGVFQEWNEHAELVGQYQMHDGTGTKRVYNERGELMQEESFEHSVPNGILFEVSKTEGHISFVRYIHGHQVGRAFGFYPNTNLENISCANIAGVLNGPAIDYSEDGRVINKMWFVNGQQISERAYSESVSTNQTLPPYFSDAAKYKEYADKNVMSIVEKYLRTPKVKIPLEFDRTGDPVPAP